MCYSELIKKEGKLRMSKVYCFDDEGYTNYLKTVIWKRLENGAILIVAEEGISKMVIYTPVYIELNQEEKEIVEKWAGDHKMFDGFPSDVHIYGSLTESSNKPWWI